MSKRWSVSRSLLGACVLSILGTLGCSKGGIPTYPVAGTIKYESGQPVPGAVITFSVVGPIDKDHKVSATGTADEQGNFTITTYGPDDGALEGQHQITVHEPAPPPGWDRDTQGAPPKKIPPKYYSFGTSGLDIDVKTDGPNELNIVIADPPKR